ncbi:MAG: 4Fe-4S binding protein [Thermoplasmatales archaeon]|jgi:MinD superfamily P-loop ATPase|nr:4Fe-4S binding protein [Thermoplasmatales archaeon]
MNIAVLSGKGGTGKTMVSVNLAKVAGTSAYVDCDVEEPNGHLYLKPKEVVSEEVSVLVPRSDPDKCDGCRECIEFCRFNAMVYTLDRVKVFNEMCHSCGGCAVICPQEAITEHPRAIGRVESGISGDVHVRTGVMDVGEVAGLPIIARLLQNPSVSEEDLTFIDCPPGSSCSVMESIKDADFCVLVTEPTIFGAHNLDVVVELSRAFNKPFGVILNKDIEGEANPSEEYCSERNIPVLGRIPFDRELSDITSEARIASEESAEFREMFRKILDNILEMTA